MGGGGGVEVLELRDGDMGWIGEYPFDPVDPVDVDLRSASGFAGLGGGLAPVTVDWTG